jgi:hypothetical protein
MDKGSCSKSPCNQHEPVIHEGCDFPEWVLEKGDYLKPDEIDKLLMYWNISKICVKFIKIYEYENLLDKAW